MRSMILVAAVVALLAGPAVAATWTPIFRGSGNVVVSIDEDTVISRGDLREGWLNVQRPAPNAAGAYSERMLFQVDCHLREYDVRARVVYRRNGSILLHEGVPSTTDVPGTPVTPDTLGSAAMDKMCAA